MMKKRFMEQQITFVLRQASSGTPVWKNRLKMGVSESTFYLWKKQFAGMGVAKICRLKQLEEESRRCFAKHSNN